MKSTEEFVKAMETAEMQESFEKFVEGKSVTTAEDAERLVIEFALENGYDVSADSLEFAVVDEGVPEEDLANVAGGGLRSENLIGPGSVLRDKSGIGFRMSFVAQDNTDDKGMRNTLIII